MLRLFPIFISLYYGWMPVPAKAQQHLTVKVTRLQNNNGSVLVSLFREGTGFPDDATRALARQKATITDKGATVLFRDIPPGNYAVAILHDENNNQKMDKNFLGIPKEGYGFSNNASAAFGPPSFRKASFAHGASRPTELTIRAKYL